MPTASPAVLVSIDGLRPDALAVTNCPTLASLRRRGCWTLAATSVMPSITLPCHVSMFHAVPPTRHGITTNDYQPMARPLPGLADVAKAAGLACAFFYNWEPLRDLSRPGALQFAYFRHNEWDEDGDDVIAGEAVRYLAGDRPDLLFVYLGTLDAWGHDHGFMSDAYLRHLERVDAALGSLLAALPRGATTLVTSDHGGHERAHGTDTPEDMTIPFFLAGPGIRAGHEIEAPVSIMDTAPTLARVLRLEPDRQWEGKCPEEIWG